MFYQCLIVFEISVKLDFLPDLRENISALHFSIAQFKSIITSDIKTF